MHAFPSVPSAQLSFDLSAAPDGFLYLPDFIDGNEEAALLAAARGVDYKPVIMHGQAAKRTVAHFGVTYGYSSWSLDEAAPLPDWVQPILPGVAAVMNTQPDAIGQLLVSHYPPGARIGWHRDAPMFGPTVAGLSLGGTCTFKLRRERAGGTDQYALPLASRSLYVIGGPARSLWQHMIPPVTETRYSLTFRTLRPGARPSRVDLRRAGDVPG
jgi:alkylated DNA repair dioxygenase AlkB